MPTTTIEVYRNGKPARGIRVSLEFTALTNMGFTQAERTNSEGIAYISHSSSGKANVYLDGSERGSLKAPGRKVFYL